MVTQLLLAKCSRLTGELIVDRRVSRTVVLGASCETREKVRLLCWTSKAVKSDQHGIQVAVKSGVVVQC
jgi:hypothetical protein